MRSAECHGEYRSANDPARQFRTPHSTLRTWGGALIDLSGKRAFVTGGGPGSRPATAGVSARAGGSGAGGDPRRRGKAGGGSRGGAGGGGGGGGGGDTGGAGGWA